MIDMEKQYREAVEVDDIPGAILMAEDTTGKFNYAKAFGNRTLLDGSMKPLELDDVLNLHSATKLITCVSALHCVEKGLISLTEDVGRLLPELKDVEVLTGFTDDGQPKLEPKDKAITLVHLLTQSSGLAFDMANPDLTRWRAFRGEAVGSGATIQQRHGFPLIFQPGTNWSYGAGVDWAGKLIERATSMRLGDYFKEHIYLPLNITSGTHWPLEDEAIKQRLIDLTPDDPIGQGIAGAGGFQFFHAPGDDFGGNGVCMSAPDYTRILHSLLANDGKLLRPETVDQMVQPHLASEAHASINKLMQDPVYNEYFGQGIPVGSTFDHGLGGLLCMDDIGHYGAGTMVWAGGYNLTWFIDRNKGLCGLGAPHFPLRDSPGKRKADEPRTLHRQGAKPYERMTSDIKQVYRKGIYEIFEEWKRGRV